MFLNIEEILHTITIIIVVFIIFYIVIIKIGIYNSIIFGLIIFIIYYLYSLSGKDYTEKNTVKYDDKWLCTKTIFTNYVNDKIIKVNLNKKINDNPIYVTVKIDALECADNFKICPKDFHYTKSFNILCDEIETNCNIISSFTSKSDTTVTINKLEDLNFSIVFKSVEENSCKIIIDLMCVDDFDIIID
jgi:hypothetical protein